MNTRILGLVVAILALIAASCSDSGKAPNSPGGGATPTLSINDPVGISEGNSVTFVVTLSSAAATDITFSYALVNRSTSDLDFSGALSGTGTITAGTTSTKIVVVTNDDADVEGSELFDITLGPPSHATIAKGIGTTRITPSDGGTDVSYSAQIATLFSAKGCGGCHPGNGNFSVANVNTLTTTGDHAPNVIPGLGGQSNLYLKTTPAPPFGSRMPLGGPYLTTDEQNLIRDWINQGASNN